MPISRAEFEGTASTLVGNLEKSIVTFLNAHPDQAFTVTEIGEGLGLTPYKRTDEGIDWRGVAAGTVAVITLSHALRGLMRKRKIAARLVHGLTYYAASRAEVAPSHQHVIGSHGSIMR